MIARTGGTIGKTYLVNNVQVQAVFASYLIRAIPSPLLSATYLKLALESPLYWEQLYEESKGTGQPNVNATSLSQLLIPLPPLAEQKCIVAKVDELLARCTALERKLGQAQVASRQLTAAVLQRVVG